MTDLDTYISVVVPVFNEAPGLLQFHALLEHELENLPLKKYEIVYCDDGSSDDTNKLLHDIRQTNKNVKIVRLSRNFGKEAALIAGIAATSGEAIITLDGDGQHPVNRLGDFITAWQQGAQVVIGLRTDHEHEGYFKRLSSWLFYRTISGITKQPQQKGTSDYRLIDKAVKEELLRLQETNRITRALIDWLGFERTYIEFKSPRRLAGSATYSTRKLITLATNAIISQSPAPLYIFGYAGVAITAISFLLGAVVFVEQLLLGDPLDWNFTGTALLSILLLFLVGLILLSQFMISLYIAQVSTQSRRRPLYVVDSRHSAGISKDTQNQ